MARSFQSMAAGLMLWATVSAVAIAQPAKSAPTSQLAVDVVALKTGRSLRGAILSRQPDVATTMAVTGSWLETANPPLFAQYDAADREAQRTAWQQARDRIAAILETPPENAPRLVFFLKEEQARLDKLLAAEQPTLPPFLLIDLPGSSIAKVTPAPAERQRLALLAWNEGWTDVETRDAGGLKSELIKRTIKLDGPAIDLSDRLPAREQDDREWAARLAVLEYTFREPIDFQGTGDIVLRTNGGKKPDLSVVFQKLMMQQMESQLRDLLPTGGPPIQFGAKPDHEWLASAIAETKAAGVRGFRVTRVNVEPQSSQTTIETRFVAEVAHDDWRTIWQSLERADASKARPEAEAKIEKDPQVKAALGSMRALGIVDDAPIRQAIRMGAATMAAQQAADTAFFAFTGRCAKRIDTPRITVPAN